LKILVTFAVEAEFLPWHGRHAFAATAGDGYTLQRAQVGEADVSVLLTGVGPGFANENVTRVCTEEACRGRRFDLCISAGLAGALRDAHLIGEVVVPRTIRSDQHGSTDGFGLKFIPDSELVNSASDCGAKIVERCLTTSRVVRSAAEKSNLGVEAEVVEMESYEVLSEASAWGTRGIAIRAVSDTVDETLPIDFSKTITDQGEVSYWRVLGEAARHPGAVPGLIRLGRNSRSAAQRLATFLDAYVTVLGSSASAVGFGYGPAVTVR
jgi:adenosylhomocysteine nucleosidase